MPKKKEKQSMDTLVLLRRRNKIPTKGDTETKCGTETEGKTIQGLPHLGIIIQLQNPDTIIDAHKYLLTRAGYSCHLGGTASA